MSSRRQMLAFLSLSRLPTEFQEVEYIESSGTQYIDTDLGLTENTGCYIDVQFSTSGNQQALGSLEPGVGRFAPCFMDSDGYIKCAINLSNAMEIYTQIDVLNRHNYEYNVSNRDIKIDGVSKGTVGSIGSTNNSIYLFRRNYSSSPLASNIKLYSCKLYDNGTLVRNFIPCYRKADNETGLYDLVNDVFYTNAGTGTFTKGNDV